MAENCFCHFNGYVVKDAAARAANAENETAIAAVRMKTTENAAAIKAAKTEKANALKSLHHQKHGIKNGEVLWLGSIECGLHPILYVYVWIK